MARFAAVGAVLGLAAWALMGCGRSMPEKEQTTCSRFQAWKLEVSTAFECGSLSSGCWCDSMETLNGEATDFEDCANYEPLVAAWYRRQWAMFCGPVASRCIATEENFTEWRKIVVDGPCGEDNSTCRCLGNADLMTEIFVINLTCPDFAQPSASIIQQELDFHCSPCRDVMSNFTEFNNTLFGACSGDQACQCNTVDKLLGEFLNYNESCPTEYTLIEGRLNEQKSGVCAGSDDLLVAAVEEVPAMTLRGEVVFKLRFPAAGPKAFFGVGVMVAAAAVMGASLTVVVLWRRSRQGGAASTTAHALTELEVGC